jgi:hypothetical protein
MKPAAQWLKWLPFLLIGAVLFLGMGGAEACPGCRMIDDKSSVELQRAGAGFSYSVLFMIAAPMGIISLMAKYIVQTVKKLDRTDS